MSVVFAHWSQDLIGVLAGVLSHQVGYFDVENWAFIFVVW